MSNVFSNVYSFLRQVGSNIILSTTGYIAARKFRAKDSNGLRLEDDDGNLGAFIEDSTGNVGIGTASPTRSLDVMNPDGQPQGRFSYNAGNFLEIGVEDNTGTGIIKASGGMLVLDPAITKVNGKLGVGLAAPSTALTVEGAVTLKEQAAADADVGAYGQVWVKTATPNELYFTTDAGDDIQLTTGAGTTGASALNDLSDVSYSSGDLVITSLDKLTTSVAAHDTAGTAVVLKGGDTTAGTTNNIAGGSLTIQGGQGKGSGAGGDIIFQTADAGSSGSSLNSLATALTLSDDLSATFTGAVTANAGVSVDNITIDGDDIILSTGPLDIQAAGGMVLESTSQSIVLDAYTGQVQIKKDGTSEMVFTAGDIEYSNNQNATVSMEATAHDAAGRSLTITAGSTTAATTNNIAGGSLTLQGGIGKGSGAGGDIIFQTANAGGSGSSMNTLATALTISDDLSIEAGGDINFTGENVTCGKFIAHYGDTDTRIAFFNAGDILALEAGGVEFLKCHETTQDELIVNNLSGDVDFRVASDDESHMLFVDANNNRISIGDSADAPAATLEVTNHASAGAYDVPLVQLNSLDTDQIALDINAGNIDANVIDITCADLTESAAIRIVADGLTTGNVLNAVSNSDSTAVRALISLKNDHVDATGVTGIALVNDALADGGVGAIFNATMGGNGSVVGLRIKEQQVTFPNSGPDAELIVANFFPANCVPIALGIRITTAITGGYVTKIGTTSDDDAFGTYADNTLEQVDDNLVAAWSPTQTQGEEGMYFRSTASLKFTTNAVPSGTAGVARIALYHYQITAPTG